MKSINTKHNAQLGGFTSGADGIKIGFLLLAVLFGSIASSNPKDVALKLKPSDPIEGYWMTDCFPTMTPMGGSGPVQQLVRVKKNPTGYDVDSRIIYYRGNDCQKPAAAIAISAGLKVNVSSQTKDEVSLKATPSRSSWNPGSAYPTEMKNLNVLLTKIVSSVDLKDVFELKANLFQDSGMPYGYAMVLESTATQYLHTFKAFGVANVGPKGQPTMVAIPGANLLFKKIGLINTPYLVMFPESTIEI